MWLSNGDGLHQYATETHELTSFQPEDGSFATGYFRHSALRRANGKMWFGGPEGITVFHPDSVEFITTSPQVHLTNLKVNGKPFQTQDSTLISQSSSFVLAPGQNYLELEFIGLEYSHPQAIKYKYFLENYDQQWTESGTYNKASYQKLPPGDYIFKVQATNSDGVLV